MYLSIFPNFISHSRRVTKNMHTILAYLSVLTEYILLKIAMIKSLEKTDPVQIINCLHEAFSDYKIPMKMPEEYWLNRWHMAHIDYSLSYGYFEGNTLCGFVLHGIDVFRNLKSFYNMATGVIPEHRGKKIVKQIYSDALDKLRSAGCQLGTLEVLCDNAKAIGAYESTGFKISDKLLSFRFPTELLRIEHSFKIEQLDIWNASKYDPLKHHLLSFEHRNSIVERRPEAFKVYELYDKDILKAYALVKLSNRTLIQFGSLNNALDDYIPALFYSIKEVFPDCRIMNINDKDTQLLEFLEEHKFQFFIDQYAMEILL